MLLAAVLMVYNLRVQVVEGNKLVNLDTQKYRDNILLLRNEIFSSKESRILV